MKFETEYAAMSRFKPWQADAFAIVATAVTLGVRLALTDQLRDRPTLVAFTVPIILSAYLGGLRAGLLATVLSYFGASYFLLPPFHRFRVVSVVDRWDLFFLVLAGVAISVLNEALHRARRQAAIATRDRQVRVDLVKAEALQSAIFNSVNFSSIATDEKGVIQIFNAGAERMLGYTSDEVVNKLTPADVSDPQEMIARAEALSFEVGTPISPGLDTLVYKPSRGMEYIYEPTFIRKNGSRFPAVVSVAALRDAQNAIIGYLLIGTDNTARKQAEEARLASEARYRTLFECAPDGIVIADTRSNYLDANPSVCRLLGFTHEEFIRMNGADIVAPADLHRVGESLRAINAGSRYEREWQFRRKDDSLVSVEVLATPMPDGNVMAVIRDITARKAAEEALLKAGALQRAIFDSANFSSIATDANGVIQIFNVGAERMLGYIAAEVMNKITPADISDPQEVIARAQALTLELGVPITPGFEALVFKASRRIEDIYELTYVRKDGSRFPAIVSVTALRDASDRIIGYLLIGTDNTARKQAEEARLASEASYRTLFEYAPDGIVIADAKSNYLDANPSICNLLGYTRQELIGKNASDIVAPAEIPFIGEALGVIHSRSAYEREWRFRRKDGSFVSAEVLATLMPDGNLMGVIRDTTARKQVDDALRKSEAQLHTVIENISEAVVVSDLGGKLLHFNPAAMEMMGYSSLEEGRREFGELADTFELSGVDGTDWSVTQWPMARILRGEKLHDLEARMRRIGTDWSRIYSFGGTIAHDPEGKPLMAIVTFSDITERKLAAEAIRKLNADLEQRVVQRTAQLQTANESLYVSQERYRSLVEGAKEYAILTLDPHGVITTWNAGARRIKGYEGEEIIGQNFSSFYTAEDVRHRKPQQGLKKALAVGQFEEDGWRVRKDGSLYWANVLITVLRDSRGIHLGFSKIVRDLTLRRQAEEKLRISEEWLRALVEGGTKYAIITLDTQGRVTTWNAGAGRIKGYLAEEVIGQHISMFYTAEDLQRGKPQRELSAAIETGQYEEDGWRVRKDGTRFWANVLISALRDSHGNHLGFSKIIRDLTDTMRAEEQARNFFRLSLELLCIAGVDGYFKVLNPAWENTLGYSQTEMCTKPFLEFVHPDDLPATVAAARRISAAEPLNHFENRYRCKDGSYRWLLWKVALSADLQLMHCAATDITQLKQTGAEIAGLNKALQLQNLELATANKELESFSYSVSHDLRAPLRSIDGFSKAILEDYTEKLDSTGQDYLHRVRGASQRMGHLIDDLLNLSRVSRGELQHETTDLSQIAREVCGECRANSKDRDVNVQIADGLIVDADPRLMRVILTNLLGNAWKFTGRNPHATIEFGRSGENGDSEFFVRDNGAGFDMAYVDKLFGAFQRLHSDKEFPGTGIGLATIQRIIHRHGGRVRAESKPGEGATFYFTLAHQGENHNGVQNPPLQLAQQAVH